MYLLPSNLFSDDSDLESESETTSAETYGTRNNAYGGISPVSSNGSDQFALWQHTHNDSPASDGYGTHSPSSSRSSSINCNYCGETTTVRLGECTEFMCDNCYKKVHNGPHGFILTPKTSPNHFHSICDIHNKVFGYVCESCNSLVCQSCALSEHKEHNYSPIEHFAATAQERIEAALYSTRMGTECIKGSIDRALAYMRFSENNFTELSENIRKVYAQIIMTIEDREQYLLNSIDKLRQRRCAVLNDEMDGLKSSLSRISETTEKLLGLSGQIGHISEVDLAMQITNGQRSLEQMAAVCKDLQPKEEVYKFTPPDIRYVQDWINQGTIMSAAIPESKELSSPFDEATSAYIQPFEEEKNKIVALPLTSPPPPVPKGFANNQNKAWEMSVLYGGSPRIGLIPAIPGCTAHVTARKTQIPSLAFGIEGHTEAKLSRPWGLCVDRTGRILVSDRRNHRVQIFFANGLLKSIFGRYGNGDGEFFLPAGICVDIENRIIVVDKDNHRVQIFTSNGIFLTKFGGYGIAPGQFRYPWDVAVNTCGQIVVSDSHNHRVQQFDSEGRYMWHISFKNHGMNRGIAAPRGVCYTPTGNIIVTDFDNHCLYLVDPVNKRILASKGHEGSGVCEFNRPSGVCCDDDGRIIVADSKNQRISVYSSTMEFQWNIEVRSSLNPFMHQNMAEKDRTCDVAVMPDGRIVLLIEPSPDYKDDTDPTKRFIHAF